MTLNVENASQVTGLEAMDSFEDDVIVNELDQKEVVDTKSPTIKPAIDQNPFDQNTDPLDIEEIPTETKLINSLLQAKGIKAPEKVLYEVEEGKVEEKNFYDLPFEDQMEILAGETANVEKDFSKEDLEIIQLQKENNLTLAELIQYYQNATIEEYLKEQGGNTSVQDYTDEEIYILDMRARLGDSASDEEIIKALEKELELPEFFKKKVNKLREEYVRLENEEIEKSKRKIDDEKEEAFSEFATGMKEYITSVEDIGGVMLEDNDKNDIINFMLSRDSKGITQFQKQMQDPKNLFLSSWAILKSQDTFEVLKSHYEGLLKATNKKEKTQEQPKKEKPVVTSKDGKRPGRLELSDIHSFDD